jgi:AraC-like DNA-binding protein
VAEQAPSAALRSWVECLWSRRLPGGHRVLPDGCADVIFDLGAPAAERAFVVGPMTAALDVPAGGPEVVVGARFRSGAARSFLGAPLGCLLDRRVALAELWPDAAQVRERLEAAAEAGSLGALAVLDRILRDRLPRLRPADGRVRAAVERLAAAPAETSIHDLARELGVTRQHLARRFRDEVGYGPKTLARVYRLRRAVRLLAAPWSGGSGGLAGVALAAGYYDQAHMNADFRLLAGRSPLELAL